MPAGDPVAERVRRVDEEGRVVEPGHGTHGKGAFDPSGTDIGRHADGTVGASDAAQSLPAPGQVTGQPRCQHNEGKQQGENDCDHEDELLHLRAEVGQRLAAGEGAAGSVANLRPDDRQARQGVAEVSSALGTNVIDRYRFVIATAATAWMLSVPGRLP